MNKHTVAWGLFKSHTPASSRGRRQLASDLSRPPAAGLSQKKLSAPQLYLPALPISPTTNTRGLQFSSICTQIPYKLGTADPSNPGMEISGIRVIGNTGQLPIQIFRKQHFYELRLCDSPLGTSALNNEIPRIWNACWTVFSVRADPIGLGGTRNQNLQQAGLIHWLLNTPSKRSLNYVEVILKSAHNAFRYGHIKSGSQIFEGVHQGESALSVQMFCIQCLWCLTRASRCLEFHVINMLTETGPSKQGRSFLS